MLFSSTVDEERETFTLKDIKEKIKFGDDKSWNPFFKDGVERIKVEQIEKYLTSYAAKEDIRYDFTFYTPSHRDVRVKVFNSCFGLFVLLLITIPILFAIIVTLHKTATLPTNCNNIVSLVTMILTLLTKLTRLFYSYIQLKNSITLPAIKHRMYLKQAPFSSEVSERP